MTDRIVRQLSPPIEGPENRPRRFSEFADQTNLVLLGDPGAGKSHLFQESARASGARFLSARTFLNIPTFPPDSVLFIDGLDEKRTSRGDQGAVDAIVQKLFVVRPRKVRISCRAADWLGESDLTAFEPYFEVGGGAVVVGLQNLLPDEQRTVLAAEGMGALEADAFLAEAEERGLADFLLNPQNLIMLVDAVKTGSWPATRKELFDLAIRLLLSESNREHVLTGGGTYSADELRETAGAICAVRLISDVDGISLSPQDGDPDYPSYRSIDFLGPDKALAALGRRVFTTGAIPDAVDYAHRTTAEYLGAGWLAGQIRRGLPFGRVRALLGVDGHPASELRGLHAWLTALLPEHADLLIDADPYGVLTYGDAGSLTPSSCRHLLSALGRLSETDPWFRAGNWESPAIGAMARPDMIDAFRSVLRSATANFGLRSVVLGALAAGMPLRELLGDLVEVLVRRQSPYAERVDALTALLRFGSDGKNAVANAYTNQLGNDAAAIRLRAEIVTSLYGEHYGSEDVAQLLTDTLESDDEVVTGALWSLAKRIPVADIPAVLDNFDPIGREHRATLERRNLWEVAGTFGRLLRRALHELDTVEPARAWQWLRVRRAFRDSYGGAETTELRETLRGKLALLQGIVEAFLDALVPDESRWVSLYEFRDVTVDAIEGDELLEWTVCYLRRAEHGSAKELFLYEAALNMCYGGSPRAQEIFAELFGWADVRDDLRAVRDNSVSCPIPEWRRRRSFRELTEEEDARSSESRRREFEENAAAIRGGMALGWLVWCARVYLALFTDVDERATPRERLVHLLGESNAEIAIDGLIAVLQRPDFPMLENVAVLTAERRHYDWWYAIIAGLDERWKRTRGLTGLSDDLLRSALAIDCAIPTFVPDDETSVRRGHDWKNAVLEERPELARDAYMALARAVFRKGEQHVDGLHELLNEEALRPFRTEVAVLFLREFPNASPFRLAELLESALAAPPAHPELTSLARGVVSGVTAVDEEQHDMWLAAAYFASPGEFETAVEARAQERPSLIWHLRDFAGYRRRGEGQDGLRLPVGQIEFLARIMGSLFPEASYPSGGWSGDTNPWDAAEFVHHLVNAISAVPSEAATAALMRLEGEDRLSSYRERIRHALANQRLRRREAEYDQPDWVHTVRALANGPPANVGDLHALLVGHLKDLKTRIASANTDIYKWFWNVDGHGRIDHPKPEESCRDILADLLRTLLIPLGITVEPEGHMAADKRADIAVAMPGRKILCELKRDYHAQVWYAAESQLERFYTSDPEAKGFGIYGVFWFGAKRGCPIPSPPRHLPQPQSAAAMEQILRDLIPVEKRCRLAAVVFDVSGDR